VQKQQQQQQQRQQQMQQQFALRDKDRARYLSIQRQNVKWIIEELEKKRPGGTG
jgi:hypothetical protein